MWACCSRLWRFLGIEPEGVSWAERAVSTLGGVVGIGATALVTFKVTGASGAALIVPSMGASSVLLFAVPHGRLSQPWSLFGGHLVSAAIGVACQQLVPDMFVAAGLAVGLAIGAMHLLDCIHPPGGATALAAVIGGPAIHELGFGYLLSPILVNTVIIFLVALAFNNIFPWRRYPASLMRFTDTAPGVQDQVSQLINKQCIEKAIQDMDLIVDMTTDDLQRLFTLTLEHAEAMRMTPEQIRLGRITPTAGGARTGRCARSSTNPDPGSPSTIWSSTGWWTGGDCVPQTAAPGASLPAGRSGRCFRTSLRTREHRVQSSSAGGPICPCCALSGSRWPTVTVRCSTR
jgi:CBS-domain-containing membrane protein